MPVKRRLDFLFPGLPASGAGLLVPVGAARVASAGAGAYHRVVVMAAPSPRISGPSALAAGTDVTPPVPVLRVGGMAFANGVVMRSGPSWAWARDDGTVLHGTAPSLLDGRPWLRLPVLRSAVSFIEMTAFSLRLHRHNGSRRTTRLLVCLVICIVASVALNSVIHALIPSELLGGVLLQVLGVLLALAVLQVGMGTEVWRYHGAEHKAVNAYEARADLRDVAAVQTFSRIHDRCGTNLVAIVVVLALVCLPLGASALGQALSLVAAVVVIAVALELFRLIERAPRSPFSRVVLFSGRTLQRALTTREPRPEHLELAGTALLEVVEAESARLRQDVAPGAVAVTAD